MGNDQTKPEPFGEFKSITAKEQKSTIEKVPQLRKLLALNDKPPTFDLNDPRRPKLKADNLTKLCRSLNDELGQASIQLKVRQMQCRSRMDIIEERCNQLAAVQRLETQQIIKFNKHARNLPQLVDQIDYIETSLINIIEDLDELSKRLPPDKAPPPFQLLSPTGPRGTQPGVDAELLERNEALARLGFMDGPEPAVIRQPNRSQPKVKSLLETLQSSSVSAVKNPVRERNKSLSPRKLAMDQTALNPKDVFLNPKTGGAQSHPSSSPDTRQLFPPDSHPSSKPGSSVPSEISDTGSDVSFSDPDTLVSLAEEATKFGLRSTRSPTINEE